MRRLSGIEIAIGVALVGTLAAVGVPAFVSELHASRLVEPTDGLARIGAGAVAWAEEHGRFPDSAPLTPASPPRGKKEADPPGTWDTPAWKALGFRPRPEGAPHAYAFSFDDPNGTAFTARAHGDLDGDGVVSTFEITGTAAPGKPPAVTPGMTIDQELE